MERYDNLDLECVGSVAEKASIFGGMFKKSSKSKVEPQDNLINDSLNDNNPKQEKGNISKGVLGKSTKPAEEGTSSQTSLSVQSSDLSASSDSLNDSRRSKEKTGVLGGFLKLTPKPGYSRTSKDHLILDGDLNASDVSLSESNNAKVSLSGQSSYLSASSDSLNDNNNTSKEKSSMFGGMFKKSNWTKGAKSQSRDDLFEPAELSDGLDNLSDGKDAKEKGGMFSGVFKKPKQLWARSQSQEDLTADSDVSESGDNLSEKTSKGGVMGKILKNPFHSSAWERAEQPAVSNEKLLPEPTTVKKEKSSDSEDEEENSSGNKQNKLTSAVTKVNPFRSANKYEKHAESQHDPAVKDEKPSGNKQNVMAGAMAKMNPFRSANKKDTDQTEADKLSEKYKEAKPKPVKISPKPREGMDGAGTPPVPARPSEEELKVTTAYGKLKPERVEQIKLPCALQDNQITSVSESPSVPARPTEEELSRTTRHGQQKLKNENQNQSHDEDLRESEEGRNAKEKEKLSENKGAKMKKPKRHNPFIPHDTAKAPSDEEGLREDESLNTEERNEGEVDKEKVVEAKEKKPKKYNPFLPRVKGKQKKTPLDVAPEAGGHDTAENDGGNRSLFDQLEDFRIDRTESNDDQDVDGLMEWWSTVEEWEDMPQVDDMTEKEEAKAFALTAEKVQKGIRVFNKLFSERAERLWQHVIDLNAIADALDRFTKKTKIAQITGGSTSAIGGVATIAGLALAPVTFGTSLIVTAVGLGVATAGGLTSAGAGISNQVNNSMDRKKVEKIVEDYQEKMADINKCMTFIKQGIENLRKFDLLKMKKHAYNRDFPALNNIYEDGAMAGKAILINANEIMRVVQIANVAGSTAARAVQIASMATGVLTGLFVAMDIYFIAKDSKELKKGAKSEFASKIREVAEQLHAGLVELNGIRDELQSTSTPDGSAVDGEAFSDNVKNKEEEEAKQEKLDDSEEDEIDRIKKAIKKDIENREYV